MPAARDSKISEMGIRVSRTRGLPPRCSASATIHFFIPCTLIALRLRLKPEKSGVNNESRPEDSASRTLKTSFAFLIFHLKLTRHARFGIHTQKAAGTAP